MHLLLSNTGKHVHIVAQTSEEGYDSGNRGWLSREEILEISDLMWDKQAADAIMFHRFASIATQTMIRPEELLQLRRRNTWLSESSDYNAKSGSIKLMEILSKGENKNNKTSRLLSWVVRNRDLDHMCPWFWAAARLMHDYQRMQPGSEDGHYGTMVQVCSRTGPKVNAVPHQALSVLQVNCSFAMLTFVCCVCS